MKYRWNCSWYEITIRTSSSSYFPQNSFCAGIWRCPILHQCRSYEFDVQEIHNRLWKRWRWGTHCIRFVQQQYLLPVGLISARRLEDMHRNRGFTRFLKDNEIYVSLFQKVPERNTDLKHWTNQSTWNASHESWAKNWCNSGNYSTRTIRCNQNGRRAVRFIDSKWVGYNWFDHWGIRFEHAIM